MELLLLADPSTDLVQEYLGRGTCFVAEQDGEVVGVYVLLPTRPSTIELVNVAVAESHQGQGIGKRRDRQGARLPDDRSRYRQHQHKPARALPEMRVPDDGHRPRFLRSPL